MIKGNKATEEYTNLVYETSRKRITLAGYRLANFAMSIFSQNSTANVEEPKENRNMENLQRMFLDHAAENKERLFNAVRSIVNRLSLQSEWCFVCIQNY